MNLRDLKYLVALADLRHFGQAAEACFVSQPTLSTQIRKLEEELGVTLIERAPRNIMLTAAGQDVVQRARRIVADVEEMKESARRSRDPESGTLRLGVFPTLGPYLLPHIIPGLRERFPQLELLLVEEKSDVLLQRLRDGKLDAALLALPLHDEQLQAQFLFDEPFLLAVPARHPLARKKTLRIEALNEETLLLLEDGHCLRDQALDVCRLSGAQEKSGFRATSLETLRQMVASGVGVTLLPALSVHAPIVQPDGIQLVPFTAPAPNRRIALVWRKSSALEDLLQSLGDVIGRQARAQLPPD
ncbi:DNA-binding transcriptional regulator OxyR [Thermomonas paludicola]|uniref:DNA-binding transcriptional regulator OxyR n=1 Tax=Thermomonas paludicola TaxID=2884874 RepID=UPI002114EB38|nr:DNA-binding transcriptional regulator OxyR [Thermomonas paludicola]